MKKQINKIRLAIIGFGGMANHHLDKMRRSGLINVIGAYDIDPERLALAKQKGIKAYNSYDELVADKPEAVLIATPNDFHEPYAVKLARDHIHVLSEKPVTLSSKSLEKMVDAANVNNVSLTVHQNRRWDKDYLIVKKIMEEGRIGNVYKVESRVMSSHGIPGAWRKEKEHGGGMVWDWGVHLIDQALQAIPYAVTSVEAKLDYRSELDVDDGFAITITFENGFEWLVVIDTNCLLPLPRWQVYGLQGTARIDNWSNKGRMYVVKEWNDRKNKGIEAGNGFTKTMAGRSRDTIKKLRLPKVKTLGNGLEFYNSFYNTVKHGAENLVTNESVMRTMKVMEAAFESASKNITIKEKI